MFMFMFANLSSDGTVDPVPVAVVADEAWDASTFKDVATSLAKEGDDQLLEIHECDDAADANRALKAGEVAGIYTVDDAGTPKLTLLSSYDSSRASSVLTDRGVLRDGGELVYAKCRAHVPDCPGQPGGARRPRGGCAPCRSRAAPAA